MAEHDEQVVIIQWARLVEGEYPALALLYAIPNGAKLPYFKTRRKDGKETRWSPEAAKLKDEGMRAGVPDLCLPVARRGYHGLYIEMKYRENKPTPEQTAYLDALAKEGYLAVVCWSAEDAIETLTEYLGGGNL